MGLMHSAAPLFGKSFSAKGELVSGGVRLRLCDAKVAVEERVVFELERAKIRFLW